jgi:hypothetical protein
MIWWFGTSIIAIILYAVLSAWEAYRCPILSMKEKLQLIPLSLLVPIVGAYFSNKKLNYKISECGRADLQFELPFWVTLGFPSKLELKDSETDIDID